MSSKLFEILAKKNNGTNFKSCQGVNIPETVLFTRSQIYGWVSTIDSDLVFKPRYRKSIFQDLTIKPESIVGNTTMKTSSISGSLLNCSTEGSPLVGYLLSLEAEDSSEATVRYFNQPDFKEFLQKHPKPNYGLLQRFLCATDRYSVSYKIDYSPTLTLMEARINRSNPLSNNSQTQATFDGDDSIAQSKPLISLAIRKMLEGICQNIIKHIFLVTNLKVQRMVLYFRPDSNGILWLTFASCLRLSDSADLKIFTLRLLQTLNYQISCPRCSHKSTSPLIEWSQELLCENCYLSLTDKLVDPGKITQPVFNRQRASVFQTGTKGGLDIWLKNNREILRKVLSHRFNWSTRSWHSHTL